TFFDAYSLEDKIYIAQQLLPAIYINDALKYLMRIKKIHGINDFDLEFIEREKAFTIPYENFDEGKNWLFDKEKTLKELLQLLLRFLDNK
ncbi:MAG: hypothetical protein QW682_05550, partial [Nitrososphaerota archaeon]